MKVFASLFAVVAASGHGGPTAAEVTACVDKAKTDLLTIAAAAFTPECQKLGEEAIKAANPDVAHPEVGEHLGPKNPVAAFGTCLQGLCPKISVIQAHKECDTMMCKAVKHLFDDFGKTGEPEKEEPEKEEPEKEEPEKEEPEKEEPEKEEPEKEEPEKEEPEKEEPASNSTSKAEPEKEEPASNSTKTEPEKEEPEKEEPEKEEPEKEEPEKEEPEKEEPEKEEPAPEAQVASAITAMAISYCYEDALKMIDACKLTAEMPAALKTALATTTTTTTTTTTAVANVTTGAPASAVMAAGAVGAAAFRLL